MIVCWIGARQRAREVFAGQIAAIDAIARRVLGLQARPVGFPKPDRSLGVVKS